jgi:hypothetical protein
MKAVGQLFDGFLEYTLNEHQQRRKGVKDYVPQDMMDILLQLSDDPNLEVQLDRTAVKAFTMVCSIHFNQHVNSSELITHAQISLNAMNS